VKIEEREAMRGMLHRRRLGSASLREERGFVVRIVAAIDHPAKE
jgi:hypothetical protein